MYQKSACFSLGVEPEIFQGKGSFVKLEHFNKHFVKNTRKKRAFQEKTLEFFHLDALKTQKNLTQKRAKPVPFSPNQETFFWFFLKSRGGLPPSCAPVSNMILQISVF